MTDAVRVLMTDESRDTANKGIIFTGRWEMVWNRAAREGMGGWGACG
jgi:hypothetical protein